MYVYFTNSGGRGRNKLKTPRLCMLNPSNLGRRVVRVLTADIQIVALTSLET